MTTVDQRFLSVRDLLQDGRICLDGPLISDATKFAVECLNLPQSVDTICERAGITRDVYNHYADILNNLFKGFNTMFEIADDFGAIIKTVDAACKKTLEFAAKAQSDFPSLFDLFRQLRDKPTPEVKEKLNKLTMELIVSANTASRTSGSISLAGVINAWNDNREYLRGMYADLVKRMQDPSLQEILEKLLNIHGGIVGLDNLKKWIESLDEHTGKAVKDLEYFRGSWEAIDTDATTLQEFLYDPHSPKVEVFLRVELAHLLLGWKDVTDEINKLIEEHLQSAVEAIDHAPHR
ncbi:hypothetical protein N7537_009115 [Penicillium hordei]|uniref:Uncharacterized protein n=1 Tax=Penicillium hordei TaxID=40994 RepID=A0AAD6DS87_9EURO|nr:uncharacterized protein N7537_009115 [Penicillium hordei]KAJ5592211.1 hypothetical protein N7537_009115 [Penicillium hordei]